MIFEKVKKIISEQLSIEEEKIKEDTVFEDLGADSLDLFQVISEIEDEWDIRIDDVDKIKTVSDLIGVIGKEINK